MFTSGKAVAVALVLIGLLAVGLVSVAAIQGGTSLQVASSVLAALALLVSAFALRHSAKSAEAALRSAAVAEDQEQRRKYGWAVALLPDGSAYELRNTGSQNAKSVRLAGDFFDIGFIHEEGRTGGSVNIDAGEAKVFDARTSYGQVGLEVEISWQPEGSDEGERKWREVIPQPPREFHAQSDRRHDARIRAEEHRREDMWHLQEKMLQLGEAYSRWKANPADLGNKLQVQLLVAALPPALAREIGYEVDVARDVWGPEEYPLTRLIPEEDRHLVEGQLAEVELMWNMRRVSDYAVYGPTSALGPNEEPRIWWAVRGYVERQKERLAGERKLRRSPEDQKKYNEDMSLLEKLSDHYPAGREDPDPHE